HVYEGSQILGRNGGNRADSALQFRDVDQGRRHSIVINRPHFAQGWERSSLRAKRSNPARRAASVFTLPILNFDDALSLYCNLADSARLAEDNASAGLIRNSLIEACVAARIET